ncbi:MAG: LuxR C-terminal-related transcriptional regulator [Hoeflea sp.]|uniref:helix-turn-helix transcriptional regulator n=1 Tax=Hoeflea sp. TaxID=1940281 RepID=UPI001DF3B3FD|nr:LuxR C-terminal-related transcriptional regulator [Hoeflea sp.]MBU4530675.1 LuxR C-terminal-related transcriptional regulator [Alphaproteobacteria bacterium]MBU4544895.1 LuxR C-terminal-related transcriptional regulator [Alphaproteobacteria bacterium]MBU4552038.1 LuxR C-terminal-related transcriptional regulator [Alphaproteobacteria bacterium]MBV1722227.1 LuxR C-terminal-related transcriptional regulator [Hoeflea sp.]MBV1761789.1 LuxR C-terminal-related transcriptional regulator [Hoeflea sp
MLMPEAAYHLGPELGRAVNRMDFFRLFKALAFHQQCQYFILSEVAGEDEGINLQHPHALHNLPESWLGKTNGRSVGSDDPSVLQSKRSTAPFSMDLQDHPSSLAGASGAQAAIGVPLHTLAAKRYCLLMFGDTEQPQHESLAVVALDATLIFQRYFEVILSLDSISGLNEREIQIVRWTSEGKTSAEIAIILGLSEHTVNSYIAAVLRKLHVVNRAQMVASALRSGLIT